MSVASKTQPKIAKKMPQRITLKIAKSTMSTQFLSNGHWTITTDFGF